MECPAATADPSAREPRAPRTAPRCGDGASARPASTASPPSSAARAEPLYVRKRDGERQRFDRTKLRAALLRSTHKRQVGADDVEALVDRVELAIETAGGELPAPSGSASSASRACASSTTAPTCSSSARCPSPNADFAESAAGGSVRAARESSSLPAQTAESEQVLRRGDRGCRKSLQIPQI